MMAIFNPIMQESVDANMTYIDVFLSYAHKDNHYRKQVQKALEKRGLSVWVDDRGIAPGESWQEAVQEAIDKACVVVVILSPDAKESRYVNRELNYADNQKKRIFPILARGSAKNAIPFIISGIQYVSIGKVSKDKFADVMDDLADAIRAHQGEDCPPV
jgi:hypothetical protein